jgi:hypothetical protein
MPFAEFGTELPDCPVSPDAAVSISRIRNEVLIFD